MPYWSSSWPLGFGGNLSSDQDSPGRYNFQNGMFIGSSSSPALGWSGLNRAGAFGNFGSLRYEGAQFGYNFGSSGGSPVSIFAGLETLKYDGGIGSNAFAPFDSKSGTLPGYRANAGIEFKPTSNLSLSLGVGYVQQSGNVDSEISSLPGASSIIPSGRLR